jgi:hypothetical protein
METADVEILILDDWEECCEGLGIKGMEKVGRRMRDITSCLPKRRGALGRTDFSSGGWVGLKQQ